MNSAPLPPPGWEPVQTEQSCLEHQLPVPWLKILRDFGVCLPLLLISSAVLSSLLNCLVGGPPGTLQTGLPFWQHWTIDAGLVGIILFEVWYLFVLFGFWVVFYSPRTVLTKLTFLLVAVLGGLMAARLFSQTESWETENFDGGIVSPLPAAVATYTNLLACITAPFSATCCCLVVQWLRRPRLRAARSGQAPGDAAPERPA